MNCLFYKWTSLSSFKVFVMHRY